MVYMKFSCSQDYGFCHFKTNTAKICTQNLATDCWREAGRKHNCTKLDLGMQSALFYVSSQSVRRDSASVWRVNLFANQHVVKQPVKNPYLIILLHWITSRSVTVLKIVILMKTQAPFPHLSNDTILQATLILKKNTL